jgi:hypothetical protein
MVWRVVAMSLTLVAGGCASVARGTSEQLAFDTVPSGAEVRVTIPTSGQALDAQGYPTQPATMGCTTPCTLQVKRADKITVAVTKPGFETESFPINPEASGEGVGTAVLGNMILAGGLVGVVVDGVSGAALDHCPNPVRITLRPLPGRGRHGAAPGYDASAACAAQKQTKYGAAQPSPDASTR